jgi:3-deoxy-D-manno-octulosonic-acid transferase
MLLYRCLFTLALPFLVLALLIRVLRRVESFADFRERLGLWSVLPQGRVIWCHAASNGELAAARPIIEKLADDHALLITCNSISGKHLVQSWDLKNADCRLASIDLAQVQRRIIRKMDLRLFALFEADFWPNRLGALKMAHIPVALVGGRISEKSAKGWHRFNGLALRVFGSFDLVCAQDSASRQRLKSLGSRSFGPHIALKSFYQASRHKTPHPVSDRDTTWLAASTHEGEDAVLLNAHKQILKSAPDTKMILAPRHPKRGDEIAKIAHRLGLKATQRSRGESLDQASELYIADTLGEMDNWYARANICFVAGSLVAKGGHTPFEPLAHDCAILHGPHFENFTEPYGALAKHQGAILCSNDHEIAQSVLALLAPNAAETQVQNARKALDQTHSLEDVLSALRQLSKN